MLMDYDLSSVLEYCFCLQLKELIFIVVVFFELGYLLGKKRTFEYMMHKMQPFQNISLNVVNEETQEREDYKEYERNQEFQEQGSRVEMQISQDIFQDFKQPENIRQSRCQFRSSSSKTNMDQLSRQLLAQKIFLEGNKIQSRGIFHMSFQKAQNPKFIRKIQKHQIITDYEVTSSDNQNSQQLIPFGSRKFVDFSDDRSILEINSYQNLKLSKFPMVEKKLVKTNLLNQFHSQSNIPMSPSLCQNGKFNKFFINPIKIGQGAFGIVYSVKSIFENKQYAIKKLFIKSGVNQERMQKILNQSIKQVSIVSQYSHPNIIRFHTCWLEIANLNQCISFNQIDFKAQGQQMNNISQLMQSGSTKTNRFKRKMVKEQYMQVSYVSSKANSDFQFAHSTSNCSSSIEQKNDIQIQKENKQNQSLNKNAVSNIEHKKIEENNGFTDFAPVFALYIQMELCHQGSLDKYLDKRRKVNRCFSFLVIDQLLHGVNYLHANGLVHRDLKPANILINKKERVIKIGDFGLSAKVQDDIQYGKIGTPSYIAPEILDKKIIQRQDIYLIDVYSIGVIFFELLNTFNKATKHEKLEKMNLLRENKVNLDSEYKIQKKLIKLMTRTKNRPTCQNIIQTKQYLMLKELFLQSAKYYSCWDDIEGMSSY